jgi:hypothetical protein
LILVLFGLTIDPQTIFLIVCYLVFKDRFFFRHPLAADRNSIETRADCQVLFKTFFTPAAYSLAPFAGNPFSDKARL